MSKLRVGVLFGGRSGEHEVSLNSATSIIAALDRKKYQIVPIGITKEGRWVVGEDPLKELKAGKIKTSRFAILAPDPQLKSLLSWDGNKSFSVLQNLDVIFPVLHGTYGEDGTVQGLLELADIPYVGCGVLASALGMDKDKMKSAFAAAGLPQVPYRVFLRGVFKDDPGGILGELEHHFTFPMFVKPVNLGSSVGISRAANGEELIAAIEKASQFDRKIIVEEGVPAREIECSILGNDDPRASVVGEVVPKKEWYDYEAKYTEGLAEVLIPAPLGPEKVQEVQALAIRAYKAVDGAGMARVDFLMDKKTEKLYVNEINTIPGFTQFSAYPKMWEASGLKYPQLVDKLIELALERHREKQSIRYHKD
jgi:D-alanine-D-alanine ligase